MSCHGRQWPATTALVHVCNFSGTGQELVHACCNGGRAVPPLQAAMSGIRATLLAKELDIDEQLKRSIQ